MTNNLGRRALLGATLASLAGAATVALAQTGPGRGPMGRPGRGMMGGAGGMMGSGGGMMGAPWTTGSYLESLKGELGITAAQEPAWKEYTDTVSGAAETMQAMHQTMYESMGTASWEERRDMMNSMFQARQGAFNSVHEAAKKLTAALDPEQKKQADQALPGLVYGRGMMRQR